jgi:hypothetical protein
MMAAPRTAFEVRHEANSLTAVERTALDWCKRAAENGEQLTRADVCRAIGSNNHEGGTGPGVLNRLEAKGHIKRTFYQRGLQVCVTETGQCTAPPRNTAPHWRHRTETIPTPAIQGFRERAKPVAAMIEAEARLLGKSLTDFLSDLAYIGWHEYQAEKEAGQ